MNPGMGSRAGSGMSQTTTTSAAAATASGGRGMSRQGLLKIRVTSAKGLSLPGGGEFCELVLKFWSLFLARFKNSESGPLKHRGPGWTFRSS